jgi:Uma2 family endonuclease
MELAHEEVWPFAKVWPPDPGWPPDAVWPPDDTEVSCLGTNLHQTTITNLRWGINEAARLHQASGKPRPWTALSQMLMLGCRRPDGTYYRTYPDVFVYLGEVGLDKGSLTLSEDGVPVLVVEVPSESNMEVDLDPVRGKPYSYAHAAVPEYIQLDPTGHFIRGGVAAWRLDGDEYRVWEPREDGRWYSEQLPIAIALEGAMAAVYLPDGRRMHREGEVEEAFAWQQTELARQQVALARQAQELAKQTAEIERLRRLLLERGATMTENDEQ